ncbi:unnamed protein product, partial [Ectocarpus sp. 12 AP-2014]
EEAEEESDVGEEEDGDDFSDMSREELSALWGVLRRLGWFSLLQDAFSGVMFSNVLAYVRRRCDGVYDQPVLDHVMRWKDEVLLRWTALLLNDDGEGRGRGGTRNGSGGGGGPVDGSSAAYGWKQRLGLAV